VAKILRQILILKVAAKGIVEDTLVSNMANALDWSN